MKTALIRIGCLIDCVMWNIIVSIVLFLLATVSFVRYFIKKRAPDTEDTVMDEFALFSMELGTEEFKYYAMAKSFFWAMGAFFFLLGNWEMYANGILFTCIAWGVWGVERTKAVQRFVFYEDKIIAFRAKAKLAEYPVSQICKVKIDHRYSVTLGDDTADNYLPHIIFYQKNKRGKMRQLFRLSLLATNSKKAIEYARALGVPTEELV